jgi:N-acetylmuramoyl-L-alanine amidase
MTGLRDLWVGLVVWLTLIVPAAGQDLSALARFDATASSIAQEDDGLALVLAVSQPVPWRVRVLDDPPRVIVDMREVDWRGVRDIPIATPLVHGLRAGAIRPGWSRLVVTLTEPMTITSAELQTQDAMPRVLLHLSPATAVDFALAVAEPDPPGWDLPQAADLPVQKAVGQGGLVIVLDPGHGGIDPGAERDGQSEAKLMLTFARELKDVLARDSRFQVVLTRDDDSFVPLETRSSIARKVGADVFISLHADALAEGQATGTTIYTLSEDASDAASETLAERHGRDDLLSGMDLSQQDDAVATVLMDMARTSTKPRTDRLAETLAQSIQKAGLKMHRHPRQYAAFSVLKAPDIPSVLIELGFLSSQSDLARLEDKAWRAEMAGAMRDALILWSNGETAMVPDKGG